MLQVFVVMIYGTVMVFLMLNVLYIYISTPQSMYAVPSVAVYCRSLIVCFPSMLLRYCRNDSAMVPVAPIIIGITYFYIPHALFITTTTTILGVHGAIVVRALRYKPTGRGFDSRWCHWNFLVNVILLVALWPWGRLIL